MDSMSKMWLSLIAIVLMVAASLLISVARTRTKGFVRVIVTIVAFIMLIYAVLSGIISIF